MKLNANVFKLDGDKPVTEMLMIDERIIKSMKVREQNTMPDLKVEEENITEEIQEPVEEISFSSLVEQRPVNDTPNATHEENSLGDKTTKKRSSIRLRFGFKRKKSNPQATSTIEEKPTAPKKKSKKSFNVISNVSYMNDDRDSSSNVVVWNETTINLKLQEISVVFLWIKEKQVTRTFFISFFDYFNQSNESKTDAT